MTFTDTDCVIANTDCVITDTDCVIGKMYGKMFAEIFEEFYWRISGQVGVYGEVYWQTERQVCDQINPIRYKIKQVIKK